MGLQWPRGTLFHGFTDPSRAMAANDLTALAFMQPTPFATDKSYRPAPQDEAHKGQLTTAAIAGRSLP